LQCYLCRSSEDDHWQAATSAQRRRPSSQRHEEIWSWSVETPWQTALAGCAWEGQLQARPHDVSWSAWTSTSVPCRAHHPSHRSCISTSTTANRPRLIVPRRRLNTYGHRTFPVAGPTVWNSLPDKLRELACVSNNSSKQSCLVSTGVTSALKVNLTLCAI